MIHNPGKETAFFVRLKVLNGKGGELALPVFFTDNYLTLLPGESREIGIDISHLQDIKPTSLWFEIEGWNVKSNSIKLD